MVFFQQCDKADQVHKAFLDLLTSRLQEYMCPSCILGIADKANCWWKDHTIYLK